MNDPYTISPVLNHRTARALIAALLFASPAAGQKIFNWTWNDGDGKVRTRAELDDLIKAHAEWVRSSANPNAPESSPADPNAQELLSPADFTDADLSDANLTFIDLSGAIFGSANLSDANLSDANLAYADLSDANLSHADLANTKLTRADMTGANLCRAYLRGADLKDARMFGANLNGADLSAADLSGAYLGYASVTNTIFEPKTNPNVRAFASAKGLELLTYDTSQDALTQLRKAFKDDGFRDQERKVTYALKRREIDVASTKGPAGYADYLFNRVCFDLTCQYGMSPGRPLQLMIALWLLCSFVYLIFFIHLSKRSGLYSIPSPEFGRDEKEHPSSPQRIRWQHGYSRGLRGLGSRALQELGLLRTAMFFSLMSAFNIGFRDINFGRWLRLLTKREYDIKAVGWARPVSGLQSLISVYFIALWILTYFGRPFE
jgi:hypothetical protein